MLRWENGWPGALVALSSSDWWYAAESQSGRGKYDGEQIDGSASISMVEEPDLWRIRSFGDGARVLVLGSVSLTGGGDDFAE